MKGSVVRYGIGIVGNFISCCLFLSPIPTFYRIYKNRAVEEFKPDPYIATVLNCALWVFYGLPFVHPNSILVVTINSAGLAIELIYLMLFTIFATHQGRKKVGCFLLLELIVFAAIAAITLIFIHGTAKRSIMVGAIADVFNVIMYASPLTVMAKVIKTRSVKYMPFWLSLTNFCNGCIWTAYALMHPLDLYVLISNSIGAVAGAVQLILYGYYYCFGVKDDEVPGNDGNNKTKQKDIEIAGTKA